MTGDGHLHELSLIRHAKCEQDCHRVEIQFKQGKYTNAVVSYHKAERFASAKRFIYSLVGIDGIILPVGPIRFSNNIRKPHPRKGNVNAGAQNKASLYLGKAAHGQKVIMKPRRDEFPEYTEHCPR